MGIPDTHGILGGLDYHAFFEEKKAPAGTLVAKPDFLRKRKPLRARWWQNRTFFEKTKNPADTLETIPGFFDQLCTTILIKSSPW